MRVWRWTLAFSLPFGLAVTVAIAWGLELRAHNGGFAAFSMTGVAGAPAGWVETVPEDWPEQPFGVTEVLTFGGIKANGTIFRGPRVRVRQGMGNGVGHNADGPVFLDDQPKYVVEHVRVGWPLKTMQRVGADDARPKPVHVLGRLYQTGLILDEHRALPLMPIRLTFPASILLWAACLLIAVGVCVWPREIRRRRRASRGACLKCGYSLGVLTKCPECGSARPGSTPHSP